jgi:predicted GIY-YIG superfamily endonuclease
MTAFKNDTWLSEEALAEIAIEYRTPYYFEWMKDTAWTHRGVTVVYILGFENGLVKVGQTRDFLTRLSAHRSSPVARGTKIFCGWRVSTDTPVEDEKKLLALAAELGGERYMKREWFKGVDVAVLIAAAEKALAPVAVQS